MAEPVNNGENGGSEYRRSNIWIDRHFQTKYALFIAGTAAVLIFVLGMLYASVLAEQHQLVGINAISAGAELSDEDAEFDAEMGSIMKNEDSNRLVMLFVSAGVLIIILTWLSIRMTFRVVGPIQAASTMLRKIRAGDDSGIRRFRKGDEFTFLADDIIDLRDTMKACERDAGELLGLSAQEIERLGGDPALVRRIRERLEEQSGRFKEPEQEG